VVLGQGGSLFRVEDTQKLSSKSGHIAHIGYVETGEFSVNDEVVLDIDGDHRFGCMRNHTATHLLNSVLHDVLPLTCQRSSYVTSEYLKFDFSVFNVDFDNELVRRVEEQILKLIEEEMEIDRKAFTSDHLANIDNLIALPGEVYPREVSVIDISKHVEPCCGTHLQNTKDVLSFVVVSVKTPTTGIKSVKCLTGAKALDSRQLGVEALQEIRDFQSTVERVCDEMSASEEKKILLSIDQMQKMISHPNFPYTVAVDLNLVLDQYRRNVKVSQRAVQKGAASEQMKVAVNAQKESSHFCHYLSLPGSEKFSLSKAVKMVSKEKPCIIFSKVKGELKAKAVVPKHLVSPNFTAKLWLDVAASRLGAKTSAPRGQDSSVNCNMAGVTNIEENIIVDVLQDVNLFVENELSK